MSDKNKEECSSRLLHKTMLRLEVRHQKLWHLINRIINKTNDKSSVINYITVDKIRYYDTKLIANKFGEFYSTMGVNLAEKIETSRLLIDDYLNKIKVNPNTLYIQRVTPSEIRKFIENLPSKNSSGYDGISNNLLKGIKFAIIAPLTKIFNLSVSTGEFPENMKLSEVIPLFKKGVLDLMVNYRPISLLITISKLLEKCMYK